MRKGITPIIAIIILLLITIALAGTAWTFLSGVLTSQIEKSFTIPNNGAFCTNGIISILVVNTGLSSLTASDFIVAQIDGNSSVTFVSGVSIQPGDGNITIRDNRAGWGWPSGPHRIDLATSSSAYTNLPVVC